jgi:hypothetical protein
MSTNRDKDLGPTSYSTRSFVVFLIPARQNTTIVHLLAYDCFLTYCQNLIVTIDGVLIGHRIY